MIKSWVLILTLVNNFSDYDNGKAIHSIEFQSEKLCEVAGQKWWISNKRNGSFICVRSGFDTKKPPKKL